MKILFFWLYIALLPCIALSQTRIIKSYPVAKGQTIELRFDYPKVVRISTWDKNEVSVEATVKINNGESNNAFSLVQSSDGGKIAIGNKLDLDEIPETYFLVENGIKTRFTTKADMDSYRKEKGGVSNISSYQQKDIEVILDIKVPANVATDLAAVYGMVELDNFDGPIKVDAKYGGIDASLTESKIGKITMTNHFGKIYSNLNLKPTEQKEQNFFTSITATPGKGPDYDISSNYGNIYLRSSVK
ncbi:hypothetical protein [Pedobacter mendelii]|uniref:Adhesin domain-containing protein n=1 Tax=Pedobacter mendelii TaxID=1908240 RepID=A0ABQ2BE07_9SPHI|nr:hypothetical protein [Pedobacter mendelii]GGI23251.1 hypothetical protein GCM10008119_06730 [Pedobacter mendelii]